MEKINVKRGTAYVFEDATEMADAAAAQFAKLAKEAIAKRGRFVVALSGGSSPPLLYNRLLQDDYKNSIEWDKVHFFTSDERPVPEESPESNFGTARRLLFSKLNIPESNLHGMKHQDTDPERSAIDYEREVHRFFTGGRPTFDLIQLGMGPDGHTASLFPRTKALNETQRYVVPNFVDKLHTERLTFTFPLINLAHNILYLIEHEEKAKVLAEALQSDTVSYPVQQVKPEEGNLEWYIDSAAARDLKRTASTH